MALSWAIDCSNPFAPATITSSNPAYGDQFGEPVAFLGDLASGHRFGGLNLTDVTFPALPTALDSQITP